MISEKMLKEIVERLTTKFKPEKIILFGSQARGTADDKSDVDLLVIYRFNDDRFVLMREMDKTLKGMKLARDVVVITPEEFESEHRIPGTIARYAWLEGRVLFERN